MISLAQVWQRLTHPPAQITDPERRRQLQLLAGLQLLLLVLGIVGLTLESHVMTKLAPTYTAVSLGLLLLMGAYALARKGLYDLAATITVGLTSLTSFAIILLNPHQPATYAFLSIALVLASLLLERRGLLFTALLLLLGVSLGLPVLDLPPPNNNPITVPIFLVVVCALLLSYRQHLNAVARDQQAALAEQSARLSAIVDNAFDAIILLDVDGLIEAFNPAAERMFSYTAQDLMGKPFSLLVREPLLENRVVGIPRKLFALHQDGHEFPIENTVGEIQLGGQRKWTAFIRDITQRQADEDRILRLNRLLRTITAVSQMVVRERSSERLLSETCRILVQLGEYRMAWVGLADRASGEVSVAAQAGIDNGYLAQAEIRCDDSSHGRGPTGLAIREGRLVVNNDSFTEPTFTPWREAAQRYGYGASAAFPLRVAGQVIGAVNIYAEHAGAFEQAETTLLRKLVDDLSYALQMLEMMAAHERAEASMRKLSSALEQTADAVMITNTAGIIEYVNPAFEQITGYSPAEVLGQNPRLIRSGKHSAVFYAALWKTILGGETFRDVFINRRKSGEHYFEEKTITPLKDAVGQITHFISTGKDVTERMQTQERLQYIAHHDALTELPNRLLLLDRLNQTLARARWHQRVVALLFIDLDRFKTINDTLGHESGDLILQQLALRLKACVRESDTVARFGGDEFVILLDDVANESDIRSIAKKVLDTLLPPFEIAAQQFYITASIGVSLYPNDGDDASTLLKNADIAMYRAKEQGKNAYHFYSAEMSARAFERLSLESSLRHALERDELRLHFQPVVDVESGSIVSVEALLRWQHPDLGLVLPSDFIPLLEETGLIVAAGEWVLETACAQLQAWHALGWPHLRMAVNLSIRQLQGDGLLQTFERNLARRPYQLGQLELEITEGMLMQQDGATTETLGALRGLGVRLAIDDFGTGYSSLSYLRRFPIDTLKIDRSFVHDIPGDATDSAITTAIIVLAQSLKLNVIAEGIETPAQRDFLQGLGCRLMQGYLFSKPLPPEGVTRLLEQRNPLLRQTSRPSSRP